MAIEKVAAPEKASTKEAAVAGTGAEGSLGNWMAVAEKAVVVAGTGGKEILVYMAAATVDGLADSF